MKAKAAWIVFWLALAALAVWQWVWLLTAVFWLGCREAGVMTGCEDHTVGSAIGRIAAVAAVLAVVGLVGWLWRKRNNNRRKS